MNTARMLAGMAIAIAAAGLGAGNAPGQSLRLDYSTYLGGTSAEDDVAVAVDSASCAYVAGETRSDDFPAINPYQSSLQGGANSDIFIAKFESNGSALTYASYLGGNSPELSPAVAVDSAGCAYVAGTTESENFPTRNPYQASHPGGADDYDGGFLAKLSSTGSSLIYSTYLCAEEGSGAEISAIALDSSRRAYAIGTTNGAAFPTVNPYQATGDGLWGDAFVAEFSSTGSALVFSTYLGGGRNDTGTGIALGKNGEILVAGWTSSSDGLPFPVVNPYQPSLAGGTDSFVSRLSSSGSLLLSSTYLGGSANDPAYGIAAAQDASILVAGWTNSTSPAAFPVLNAYQSSCAGSRDAFLSRFSSSGSALLYSTCLGGSGADYGYALGAGPAGGGYVCGLTSSQDFPTLHPYQASIGQAGYDDIFIARLSSSGSRLVFSSYLGGASNEFYPEFAVDRHGALFIAGSTASSSFPTLDPYQASRNGSSTDAVLSSLLFLPPAAAVHTDFDGDGTSEIAVFRGGAGLWAIRNLTRLYLGTSGDQTVPGDYDGDGTSEIGVFRDNAGMWAVRNLTRVYFGTAGDAAVPGDYDGDGRGDIGLFRGSESLWAVRNVTRVFFGGADDVPIPADFIRPGVRECAIFRPANGMWAAWNFSRTYFGTSGDIPLAGNFDEHGGSITAEPCLFRPSTGLWAIANGDREYFGASGDKPVPADYDGDGAAQFAIFRDDTGLWAVHESTRIYFGSAGDVPVTE